MIQVLCQDQVKQQHSSEKRETSIFWFYLCFECSFKWYIMLRKATKAVRFCSDINSFVWVLLLAYRFVFLVKIEIFVVCVFFTSRNNFLARWIFLRNYVLYCIHFNWLLSECDIFVIEVEKMYICGKFVFVDVLHPLKFSKYCCSSTYICMIILTI